MNDEKTKTNDSSHTYYEINATKKEAMYWYRDKESKESNDNDIVSCSLCPHGCKIDKNKTGVCGVRKNIEGKLIALSYGKVSSLALDPIEKKPLYKFHSGKNILSVGSIGCNFTCPFCQNYSISKEFQNIKPDFISPDLLVSTAEQYRSHNNIGLAYTYNEPLIGFEYVLDCSKLIKEHKMKNVLVTNGYINGEPLMELLQYIDAMNIDIKGGTQYTRNVDHRTHDIVRQTVKSVHKRCHVEITTLIIPGENENDVEDIAKWISSIDKKIPYHLSRFFPKYKYKDREATPKETMFQLYEIASSYLDFVYLGNM